MGHLLELTPVFKKKKCFPALIRQLETVATAIKRRLPVQGLVQVGLKTFPFSGQTARRLPKFSFNVNSKAFPSNPTPAALGDIQSGSGTSHSSTECHWRAGRDPDLPLCRRQTVARTV